MNSRESESFSVGLFLGIIFILGLFWVLASLNKEPRTSYNSDIMAIELIDEDNNISDIKRCTLFKTIEDGVRYSLVDRTYESYSGKYRIQKFDSEKEYSEYVSKNLKSE